VVAERAAHVIVIIVAPAARIHTFGVPVSCDSVIEWRLDF
jgi:hypothetical protein